MGMNFCPKCGTELKAGMNFCHNCGYALSGNASANEQVQTQRKGKLTVVYEGTWSIGSATYHLSYNDKQVRDFKFDKPFSCDIPIELEYTRLKVSKWGFTWVFDFNVDPRRDYICRLAYTRLTKQFTMKVYDDNNRCIYKDTLF